MSPSLASSSSRLAGAVCLLTAAGTLVALVVSAATLTPRAPTDRQSAAPDVVTTSRAAAPAPVRALLRWDRARARAWAEGDGEALRALYAPGSRAGARDLAMLRRWRARGLAVQGMRNEVLSARVLTSTARRAVLKVTDRLTGASATGRGAPLALPDDLPTTRRVTMRRLQGAWRVVSVDRVAIRRSG